MEYRERLMQAMYFTYMDIGEEDREEVRIADAELIEQLTKVDPQAMECCGLYENYVTPLCILCEQQGFYAGLRAALTLIHGKEVA